MADEIKFKIEDDGKISYTTDKISPMNHRSADDLFRYTKSRMGGQQTSKSRESTITLTPSTRSLSDEPRMAC